MKDIFHSNGFRALIVAVFVLFGLMLYTARTGSSIVTQLLGLVSTPMQRVSTAVTQNAADAASAVTRSPADLAAENEALKKQVAELNKKLIKYYTYQYENAQLRKYVELKNENQDFKPVLAGVVGRDPNSVFASFQIDKGSLSGISVNDPVITDAGVVGWVSGVSAGFSRVTTVFAEETKISAIDKVNRDSGVVCSGLKLADRGLVRLSYLGAGTTVKAGDIVVTSGLGGVYPRDLPIGTVTKVANDPYDVSLYAEVKPFVDVKSVRDVMVITSFEGQGQVLSGSASSGSASSGSASSGAG